MKNARWIALAGCLTLVVFCRRQAVPGAFGGEIMTTYRVKWMATVAALAFAAVAGGPAAAADKVRLRLNWMYYGSHAGFAYGKDKGIFDRHGIDLDIRSGNGSGSAHRLVANGDSTFSYGSCASMVNLAAQGAPLMSVAVID